MSNFKYDIVSLIKKVESKPCIWDKTNEFHKNRIVREKSWQEIFLHLEDDFENLSQSEKKKTGETIMSKWSNIRDSFLRSLRLKYCHGTKKSYLYSEHLQFLKINQKDETDSNISQDGIEDNSIEVEEFTVCRPSNTSTRRHSLLTPISYGSTSRENPTASKRNLDYIEDENIPDLKKEKTSDEVYYSRSDHEMLLLSFIPYLRDMSEAELMDMQMEFLITIKNIKQNRSNT